MSISNWDRHQHRPDFGADAQRQANSQLPSEVTQQGVIVQPGTTAPFMFLDLYSPNGAYDNIFLANYATINLQYALTRIQGVGRYRSSALVHMPCASGSIPTSWPTLASRLRTSPTPSRRRTKLTPRARSAESRFHRDSNSLITCALRGDFHPEDFENIVRAQPDGSILRLKDVAEVEMGVAILLV